MPLRIQNKHIARDETVQTSPFTERRTTIIASSPKKRKKRKTGEKGTLSCGVNSVEKKRRKQMKTAERPARQSAGRKMCIVSFQLSVWKVDPSSSMDGAEIILQGRRSARAYRNQTQKQHPPECRDSSEKEAHRGGPAHIHCPTFFSYRWLPGE